MVATGGAILTSMDTLMWSPCHQIAQGIAAGTQEGLWSPSFSKTHHRYTMLALRFS